MAKRDTVVSEYEIELVMKAIIEILQEQNCAECDDNKNSLDVDN